MNIENIDNRDINSIPTGFDELDKLLTGLHGGDLIVVAGRPAMGKSSFALNMVNYLAIGKEVPCLLYSYEMSRKQIRSRLINICGDEIYERLQDGIAPIYVEEDIFTTPEELYSMAKEYKEDYNIGFIVIDYLQLFIAHQLPELKSKAVSDAMADLKKLAKELDVPVVVLSQLNRDVEKREDKRPVLSDLKESESIQAMADVIMLLYREDYYYYPDESARPNTADIIVVKNSHGETGTVELGFARGRYFE